METDILIRAIIYLSAAVLCVPIAKKLGLSSMLGYLLAGIIIGPFVLGLIGQEGQSVMHFAEFGIVMMLFLVGLEMEPIQFWKMRKTFLGMGSMQLFGTSLLLFNVCLPFTDWNWKTALVISLTLSLSSSVIVSQNLSEKEIENTPIGQSLSAVLLFQDIIIIPLLVLLPVLSTSTPELTNGLSHSLISNLSGWLRAIISIGTILLIYFSGRFIFVFLFNIAAGTRLQELFTASALLLVVSVSCLMYFIGLSPALGSFISGVVLAGSQFRHELESDIAPFKGLLIGLFFIGIGTSINFHLIISNPVFIIVSALLLISIKFVVSFLINRFYEKKTLQNIFFALGLSHAGEFGFIFMGSCIQLHIVPKLLGNQIMVIIAMSMLITPFIQVLYEHFIYPKLKLFTKI